MTDQQFGAEGPEGPDRSAEPRRPGDRPVSDGSGPGGESPERERQHAAEPGLDARTDASRQPSGEAGTDASGATSGQDGGADSGTGGGTDSGTGGHAGGRDRDTDPAADDDWSLGPAVDEQALRRLLQTVVDDIEPSQDSLEQLRRAVPARRTRKRQALVGAAAAVLFAGTAVPALVHVANTDSAAEDRPANAASSQLTQGTGEQDDTGSGADSGRRPGANGAKDGKNDSKDGKKEDREEELEDGATGGGADPSETMAVSSPSCLRTQLGSGTAFKGEPDAEGKIYGTFQVLNVSATACAVSGPGAVTTVSQGNAETIPVIDHTPGDAATGLPDPATEVTKLILKPGQAYEVKFAWVPAEGTSGGCPTPGASPDPSSSGSTSGDPQTQSAQETSEEPPQPTGGVLVRHTPDSGEPAAAETTLSDVCSGTIYRTGVLAVSS